MQRSVFEPLRAPLVARVSPSAVRRRLIGASPCWTSGTPAQPILATSALLACRLGRSMQGAPSRRASSTSGAGEKGAAEADAWVHTDVRGCLGIVTLDRPKALNAANVTMVRAIHAALDQWAVDDGVGCVVLRSSTSRCFCSGGDVKSIHGALVSEGVETPVPEQQLGSEYRLLLRMFTYPKPLVALVDGITFGFGLALCAFCRYALATETSRFAMPENRIGLFPDVGFSYLAATRMRAGAGVLMGLCDEQLVGGSAARDFGIATHAGHGPECLKDALESLAVLDTSETPEALHDAVRSVLDRLSATAGQQPLAPEPLVERCFFGAGEEGGLAAAYAALRAEAQLDGEDAAAATELLARLSRTCPTSQAVFWELLRAAKRGVADAGDAAGEAVDLLLVALAREYRAAQSMTRRGDFVEGVRATLVDKDQAPTWSPPTDWESCSDTVLLAKEITALDDSVCQMLSDGLQMQD